MSYHELKALEVLLTRFVRTHPAAPGGPARSTLEWVTQMRRQWQKDNVVRCHWCDTRLTESDDRCPDPLCRTNQTG